MSNGESSEDDKRRKKSGKKGAGPAWGGHAPNEPKAEPAPQSRQSWGSGERTKKPPDDTPQQPPEKDKPPEEKQPEEDEPDKEDKKE